MTERWAAFKAVSVASENIDCQVWLLRKAETFGIEQLTECASVIGRISPYVSPSLWQPLTPMVWSQCRYGKMQICVPLLCEVCAYREYSYHSPHRFHLQQEDEFSF